MVIKHILFDLDNTLYSKKSGIQEEIVRRMINFVSDYLKISFKEAEQLRKTDSPKYGTTLKWLIEEYQFKNIENFLESVHPKNLDEYIHPDIELQNILNSINIPKSIFTNSPREHANRVLTQLKIKHCFNHMYDIRYHQFQGKPYLTSYQRIIKNLNIEPKFILFIDDNLSYILPFEKLGGNILLLKNKNDQRETNIPSISNIIKVKDYLDQILN
jgi:putative hydrolase of the HAD superfamily